MDLQTLTYFGGLSVVAIIYWLVEKASAAGILKSKRARFLAPGVLSAPIVAAWYVAQNPRPAAYIVLLLWMGLWVAAMLFKSGVKDNERKGAPEPPAPTPQGPLLP